MRNSSSKDSGGKYQAPGKQRLIPGMAPPSANPAQGKKPAPATSTSTTSNASKKVPGDAAAAAGKGPAPAQKPAVEVDVKLTAAVDKVLAAEEKEKRVKALKKKLKQLDEIKAKVAENQAIDADQVRFHYHFLVYRKGPRKVIQYLCISVHNNITILFW